MTQRIETKLITTLDRSHVLTSRGKCLGPIYPYIEDVDQILYMIKTQGLSVYEVIDNKGIELTELNYDKDNSQEEPSIIIVQSVALDQSSKQLKVGESFTLMATVLPTDATNTEVTWESSSVNVASVVTGSVTAKEAGSSIITVKTLDGNHTATCNVLVTQPVSGITLDKQTHSMDINDTIKLVQTISPSNASNKEVVWESSNPVIAKVENGLVTGLSKGNTNITVKTVDGNHIATCAITIISRVVGITLEPTTHTMNIGGTIALVHTINPTNANDTSVTWESSESNIAKVENGLVTGLSKGTSIITVKTVDGNKTAICTVTIESRVLGITLEPKTHTINVNDTVTLIPVINPVNANNTSVTWESASPEVVSVENGVITGLLEGSSTITVKTVDGNHTATCDVVVNAQVIPE